MYNPRIKSFINYTGNKYKLLPQILPLFPKDINKFIDLCCGSGTVGMNVQAKNHVYNDINFRIVEILRYVYENREYVDYIIEDIENVIEHFQLTKTNKEGFEKLREHYNLAGWIEKGRNPLMLYTLMCYSFNYQCRFNNDGFYNGSFGRNRSSFTDRQRSNLISCCNVLKGQNSTFSSVSIADYDYSKLKEGDFVYIDPPYLGTTGNYNDGTRLFGDWGEKEESNLYDIMYLLDEKNIKFAVSNNLTINTEMKEFLKWSNFRVHHLNHDYNNCNYQKKDKIKDDEVLITNY